MNRQQQKLALIAEELTTIEKLINESEIIVYGSYVYVPVYDEYKKQILAYKPYLHSKLPASLTKFVATKFIHTRSLSDYEMFATALDLGRIRHTRSFANGVYDFDRDEFMEHGEIAYKHLDAQFPVKFWREAYNSPLDGCLGSVDFMSILKDTQLKRHCRQFMSGWFASSYGMRIWVLSRF